MIIRPFRDDVSAWNCVTRAAQDTQSYIVMIHKGSMTFREGLVTDVRRMRQALQIAITEGGRPAFEIAIKSWEGHEMAEQFMKNLNRHLATIPAPKRRSSVAGALRW